MTDNKSYSSNELKDNINYLAMSDILSYGIKALPVIMIFEVYMIGNWIINFDHTFNMANYGYLFAYASILLVSLFLFLFTMHNKKKGINTDKQVNNLLVAQNLYGILFLVWSVFMTYLDATFRDSFSVIIFVTIISITPLICYISPYIWGILELFSGFFVAAIAKDQPHFTGFLINFSVFIIISIVTNYLLHKIKTGNYKKQHDLEVLRKKDHFYAYYDMDTGLKNRRSYYEDIKNLSVTDDLVVGMIDLYRLKRLNDKYGQNLGDQLINGTAKILTDLFSDKGEIYRLGGDDFCIVLRNVDPYEIKESIKKKAFEWNGYSDAPLKILVGIATPNMVDKPEVSALLKEADKNLAKEIEAQ